jgi:plastocyanin
MSARSTYSLLALVPAALILACGSEESTGFNPPPTIADVKIVLNASLKTSTAYNPNPFTVSLNGQPSVTVVWGNDDVAGANGVSHTVTEDGNSPTFDSEGMDQGETFEHVFAAAGTYNYHCKFHEGMIGKVIVTQ